MSRRAKPFAVTTLALALLFAAGGFAQAQEAAVEKGVTIEGITEYRLKNGCRFLLFPDPSSSKVTVNMTVLVGSRQEGYGETGMAHLLEHMLFKGSVKFPHIDKVMQKYGADYNGTTSLDRTNYYETMPAGDANLEFGIKLEADRLVNSFIKREDLVLEMPVVRNEFEMGENSPGNILTQRINAVAYEWHNYGKSTIGNRADIERVPIDRLQAFYKKYYQPDNIVVIVAGRFNEAKAAALIAENFGAIPAPKRKLAQTYTEEPPQDGERTVTLRRVGKGAVVGAVYHIPAAAHEDNAACEMLGFILGHTPSGRLYKQLVKTKMATSVYSNAMNQHDPGLFEVMVQVQDSPTITPEQVRDEMLKIVEGAAATPFTKDEVDRAKQRYLSMRERSMAKSQSIALELSEWAGAGDWRLLFVHRDRIAKITPDEVNKAAVKYLAKNNRTVGLFLPTKEPSRATVPEAPAVAALVKEYKGGKELALGEEFDPSPENIEKRVKRIVLPSGVKVALLPKKTRGETVVGRVALHFGNEKSLTGKTNAAGLVGPMLMRGTKQHTREEIVDELDTLNSSLSASSDTGSVSFSLESKRDRLPKVLALLREVLREPTFPVDELDIIKRSQKQSLEKSMVEPNALASLSLRRQLSPYPKENIRYVPTFQESLERMAKVTRDDVVKLYEDQLGASVGEVVLVGDFDPDAVTKQLEGMFAGWKSSVPYARIPRSVIPGVKGNRETIQTPDKENAIYLAGVMFEMKDTDPDYPAMSLGDYVLGSSGFTSRLMDRLRQKEGWSYGAGSQLTVNSQDKVGVFMAYAMCNPNVIEKVDKAAHEEISKAIKEGVSADELKAAQKGYLAEMKVERGSDSTLASMLQRGLYLGRTMQYYADLEKQITGLDVKGVNQALARHLDAGRLVIVRAGDFKNKKE